MTTTAATKALAWLAREARSLGSFVVRFAGGRVDFGELAPGQCVVVVDTTGALKCVGRIRNHRIRRNLESTTLYLDACSRA